MDKERYAVLKAKFLKAFANLPEKIRSEHVVVIVDDNPFTWNSAVIEIKNDSKTGKKIIKIVSELKII